MNNHVLSIAPVTATQRTTFKTPTIISTKTLIHLENELSDISKDGLIDILKQKFYKQKPSLSPENDKT
ncbi:unnamed protein product, partial [Rotaria sp. Silwood2]